MLLKTFISCTKAFVSTSLCQQSVFSESSSDGGPLDPPSRLLLGVLGRKMCTAWANLYMLRFKTFHLGCFFGMRERNITHLKASLEWRALTLALFQGALQHKRWGSVACVLHSCWDLTGVSVALQAVKAVGYRGGLPVEDHSHILGLKEVWIG